MVSQGKTQRQDSKPFVYSFKYTSSGIIFDTRNLEKLNDDNVIVLMGKEII